MLRLSKKEGKLIKLEFNQQQRSYTDKLWDAGCFCYTTCAKLKPMGIINSVRDANTNSLITNYNKIVAYYKNVLPITERVLEDSRIVNAYQVYVEETRNASYILAEYQVPENIFLPSLDEVPVFKYLFGTQVSETVYDSYMHLQSFVDAHLDVLDNSYLSGLYKLFLSDA